jgi:hypothetical protein
MVENTKSLIDLKIDYNLTPPTRLGVGFSEGTFYWKNGSLTVTDKTTSSFNPTIYSSYREAKKQIDSSEYFPLATLTAVNTEDQKGVQGVGIRLSSEIQVSLEGSGQGLEFAPLKVEPIEIGIADFGSETPRTDQITFDNLFSGYRHLRITNPQTGKIKSSPFYFSYVGAVEGEPQSITKDQLVLPGKRNSVDFPDGETLTYTIYGRLFKVAEYNPVKITGITEDTGVKNDFRTSDNTLVFNGTAELGSKVEVFLDDKSIGTTNVDAAGNWSYDHTAVEIPDGEYELTATATNLFGEVSSTKPSPNLLGQPLVIDTDYDIDLDFTDSSVAGNKPLQDQIQNAAEYWEKIILDDIPDVKYNAVGGLIDDLKIKIKVANLTEKPNEDILAFASNYQLRKPTSNGTSKDPLTGQNLSSFDNLPYYATLTIDSKSVDDITGVNDTLFNTNSDYGLLTLQHEIAHAIGFNSKTFDNKKTLDGSGNLVKLVKEIKQGNKVVGYGFTGNNANRVYQKELGGFPNHTSVPLENDNNPRHWNEWLFPDSSEDPFLFGEDELMTTSTPPGEDDTVLSKLTLGAFKDLGFIVDESKAGDIKVFQSSILGVNSPLANIKY